MPFDFMGCSPYVPDIDDGHGAHREVDVKLQVVIPHRDSDGSDNGPAIEAAIRRACGTFGGATVYDARGGYWLNAEGRLYVDPVAVIVSAATDRDAARAELLALAREVLAATDQEVVFLSVGGEAEIIE
jgi:hypothetical protein